METRIASHGLNVTSASRVFFLNSPWQRSVERQAIKRAHRIGQTREVYVERLVLGGTIEEEVLRRREEMGRRELEGTKRFLEDGKLRGIISSAKFVPPIREEDQEEGEEGGFGRLFKVKEKDDEVDRELEIIEQEQKGKKRKAQVEQTAVLDARRKGQLLEPEPKKRKLRFEDADMDEIPRRSKIIVSKIPQAPAKDTARRRVQFVES